VPSVGGSRPEKAEELALVDVEVDVVDREESLAGIGALDRLRDALARCVAPKALGQLLEPDCDVSHPGGHLLCGSPPWAARRAAVDRAGEYGHRRRRVSNDGIRHPPWHAGCEIRTSARPWVRNP
jgi:hypothetical protein